MTKITHYIGFDVSKEKLDLTIITDRGIVVLHQELINKQKKLCKAVQKLIKELKLELDKVVFCIESTGIYSIPICYSLYDLGASIWLASSLDITKSSGLIRGKNDMIDSMRIAQYAMRNIDKYKKWEPTRNELLELDELLKTRNRLLKAKKLLKQSVNEAVGYKNKKLSDINKKHSKKVIEKIDSQIKEVENEMLNLVKSDLQLSHQFDIVKSVSGVGNIVALNMIVKTKEFTAFETPEQFACYCGIAPFEHTSGKSVRGKTQVSTYADKKMKTILHLAALSATKSKGELNDYYNRKIIEGKNKMSILNAIRNKIIHRVFACIRENRKYEKNYQQAIA